MNQNWARYWRPQGQCPRQGSCTLIRGDWTVFEVGISRRVRDNSYANMDLEKEGDSFEWPDGGLKNQDTLDLGPNVSNKLYSCEYSPGEWVTGGLRTGQTKTRVFSPGRERMPETGKARCCTAELWTQEGSPLSSRDGIEVGVNTLVWGVQCPLPSSYPRTTVVISW